MEGCRICRYFVAYHLTASGTFKLPSCMRKLKYIFIIYFLNVILSGCKQVYNPPSVKHNPFFLVVDGIVISGNDSTRITLSRTKSLTDSAPAVKESGAKVFVSGASGIMYPLTELGNGQYVTSQLNLNSTEQYQLKIITTDGNEFRSAFSKVLTSPSIDSVYWVRDSSGVQIYL